MHAEDLKSQTNEQAIKIMNELITNLMREIMLLVRLKKIIYTFSRLKIATKKKSNRMVFKLILINQLPIQF